MKSYFKIFASTILTVGIVLQPVAIIAADETKSETKLETERLTAEAELVKAKAGLEKARLEALNLPKIENKTDISGANAGQIEAAMLASRAVDAAAIKISDIVKAKAPCPTNRFLVLTGTEKVDLNQPVIFKMQITAIQSQLNEVAPPPPPPLAMGVGAVIGIVNAAASLFANDSKITAVDLQSIDATLVAQVVAGKLATGDCDLVSTPSGGYGVADLSNADSAKIPMMLDRLFKSRNLAIAKKITFGEKPTDAQKKEIIAIDIATKAYDDFMKAVTTVDANGATPLTTAIVLDNFEPANTKIVRIWVNKAGGSLINTKNIVTMLGVDPVKVSGGMVVSYSMVNAATGSIESSGLLTCQTSLASLRKIQNGKWKASTGGSTTIEGEAFCKVPVPPT